MKLWKIGPKEWAIVTETEDGKSYTNIVMRGFTSRRKAETWARSGDGGKCGNYVVERNGRVRVP